MGEKGLDYDFGLQIGRMEEGINTLIKQQKDTKKTTDSIEERLGNLEVDVAKIAQWKTDIAFNSLSIWTRLAVICSFVMGLLAIIVNILMQ